MLCAQGKGCGYIGAVQNFMFMASRPNPRLCCRKRLGWKKNTWTAADANYSLVGPKGSKYEFPVVRRVLQHRYPGFGKPACRPVFLSGQVTAAIILLLPANTISPRPVFVFVPFRQGRWGYRVVEGPESRLARAGMGVKSKPRAAAGRGCWAGRPVSSVDRRLPGKAGKQLGKINIGGPWDLRLSDEDVPGSLDAPIGIRGFFRNPESGMVASASTPREDPPFEGPCNPRALYVDGSPWKDRRGGNPMVRLRVLSCPRQKKSRNRPNDVKLNWGQWESRDFPRGE